MKIIVLLLVLLTNQNELLNSINKRRALYEFNSNPYIDDI